MDDPDFLAERRRVREELERTPVASAALTACYAALTAEFHPPGVGRLCPRPARPGA
jgi:hypothetical protein